MTAAGKALTGVQAEVYVASVLGLYVKMPETPPRANAHDRQQAQNWMGKVSLESVETALLLASLRRLSRPATAPRLARIRSLAYFQPVIEELLEHPPASGYLDYLRRKMSLARVTKAEA
jgi:hypothetical protein